MKYEELRAKILHFRKNQLAYLKEMRSDKATLDAFLKDMRDILISLKNADHIAKKYPAPKKDTSIEIGNLIKNMIHYYLRCTTPPSAELQKKTPSVLAENKENLINNSPNIIPEKKKSFALNRSHTNQGFTFNAGNVLQRASKLQRTNSLPDIRCAKPLQNKQSASYTLKHSPRFYNLGSCITPPVSFHPEIPRPSQQSLAFLRRIEPYLVTALDKQDSISPLQPSR